MTISQIGTIESTSSCMHDGRTGKRQ
uniref:Uncharacterized protein n=1 Tax=Arundo donax TaxID=35708 RepID=A0A0A9GR17_ARUDO